VTSRNIVRIRADAGGEPVALTKLDKQTWQAAPLAAGCRSADAELRSLCAWDLSVRARASGQTHGFYNGSQRVPARGGPGRPAMHGGYPCPGRRSLHELARGHRAARRAAGGARATAGRYQAADYDELIDHPVEMGTFALASFRACGMQHDVVFTGKVPQLDLARLCRDLSRSAKRRSAVRTAHRPRRCRQQPPLRVHDDGATDGYGGLEHRASTALMCARNDLPVRGNSENSDGYARSACAATSISIPGTSSASSRPLRAVPARAGNLFAAAVAVRRLHQLLR
jgi:predicted metalloprotease with PDZ domain